ncbi:MAG: alpha/beta hydrolase [Fibrobacter sp.]|nr:alpha/beta hydrolase [Fibrobacter sp.]MCQ2120199.1 alpha/beta hydrolase [Fibrobacter sp.]
MAEKWVWLPDWAFDLSLWEDELSDVADANHSFISYEKLAGQLENPYKLPGMSVANVVVASGLGALSLMLASKNRPKNQKWILLSAFADFCDEESSWTEPGLLFLAKQLKTALEPTLNTFGEVFAEEFEDWEEDWFNAARKMNPELLAQGLEFLATHQLKEPLENSSDIQVVYGKMDKAIVPSRTEKLQELLPEASFRERPKAGHWPPMLLL